MPDLHLPMIRGKRLEPYGDKSITGSCRCGARWARVSAVIGVLEPQEGEPNGLVG